MIGRVSWMCEAVYGCPNQHEWSRSTAPVSSSWSDSGNIDSDPEPDM